MSSSIRFIYLLLAAAVLVNFSGLFVTVIGTDGTLYADVARTMAEKNNYRDLFAQGQDWLDKPHFPFWITAFSFELFGVSTWAYKLPAILFVMMAAVYTYLFAKKLYNKETAVWSVIILLTAEHIIISNNDVRAEPYLTGLIIASIYHFHAALHPSKTLHLIAGAFFAACAVMTKGMFALIPVGAAIAGHLIMHQQWKQLFHLRWLAAALLILLFITPELYCLYYQFDMHPEKTVFGKQGVSGLQFFFWDSQFGRFFNTGPIKGKGDLSFFLHTLLWAFLPWSLLLYAAFIKAFRNNFRQPELHEWLCFWGSLITFLIFSISKFQLPHYLNIVFPLFAIVTAHYLLSIRSSKTIYTIYITQSILVIVLIVLGITLHLIYQPHQINWIVAVLLLLILAGILLLPANNKLQKAMVRTSLAAISINLYLNLVLYPDLMQYQSGSEAGKWINKNYPGMRVAQFRKDYSSPLDFYLDQPLIVLDSQSALPSRPFILYQRVSPGDPGVATNMVYLREFPHYHISRLTLKFMNKATRKNKLDEYELVLVR